MKYLLILEEYKESLEYLLRKHPKYIPLFKQFNNEPFERLKNLYNKLNTYRELYDFDQISNFTTYEQVDDFISKLIIDKQKNDYVYQFISNKYKHLISDETIELFDQIRKVIGNDRDKINDLIIKKLAIYKNTAVFNKDLNTILTNLTGEFNVDSIIKKYNGLNIVFNDNRVVIYDIKDYGQMCRIDNSKWCIVRDINSFNKYYKRGLTKQYVIFDTSKSVVEPLHMIGITINPDGSINACHDYNDNDLKSMIKAMDIYILYKHYLKPEYDNIVNKYANKYIGYDMEKILKYGLIEYYIKCVDSGHIDPSAGNNYVIIWAAANGHLDLVKYLIGLPKEYGIDPSADGNHAIRYAAYNGHLDVVKYLISLPKEYGIDPSTWDNYAIRFASENGHLDVVKYLISLPKEYGINPSADNNYAIRWAARYGRLDVVRYLLSLPKEYGINPSADNNSATIWAIMNGHLDVVEYLLNLNRVKSTLSKERYQKYLSKIKHK